MWWIAVPVAVIAAKKLYDVVTEDDYSSSNSNNDHDNSAQSAQQARDAEAAKAKKARAKHLHEQTELMVHQELKFIRQKFLQDTHLPTCFSKQTLVNFSMHAVSCKGSAEAALSLLCKKPVKLKLQPTDQVQLDSEIAGLNQLEQLIIKL